MIRHASLLLGLILLSACQPAELPAHVVRVIDGDSLVVMIAGHQHDIRIPGINAPEIHAPCAAEKKLARLSRAYLQSLLSRSGNVHLRPKIPYLWQRDKYGRLLANIQLSDGRDVATELLRTGHALRWWPFMPKPTWCVS